MIVFTNESYYTEYQEKAAGIDNKNYSDRSEKRRVKVGSSNDHEKTIQASVDTSISR